MCKQNRRFPTDMLSSTDEAAFKNLRLVVTRSLNATSGVTHVTSHVESLCRPSAECGGGDFELNLAVSVQVTT